MTSITKNLPFFIREPAVAIIGQKCYTTLIENLELGDVDCLKYAISKGLGIGIVAGGAVMKVPQLLLITRARSARGLNLTSYILETLAYAINLAYISTPTLTSATTARNPHAHLLPFTAATLLVGLVLLFSPAKMLAILQVSTLQSPCFSKLPQIAQTKKHGALGNSLRWLAVGAQTLGCLARFFTTATEVDDILVAGSVGSEKARVAEKPFLTTDTHPGKGRDSSAAATFSTNN
ncbi:mannose-P-dolichol utilization defect 1 protein [Rhizoctonia solani]|uniref:Mannose-P-dolichol utilization defect 1 protein n=1 Tax=Rhizoctonia solani TaxID=456999 RepID=A0A8H7IH20_9AGAM|nr:mannose-P-dolichol utilization defect 1 protein [Rhizoctonia solani]